MPLFDYAIPAGFPVAGETTAPFAGEGTASCVHCKLEVARVIRGRKARRLGPAATEYVATDGTRNRSSTIIVGTGDY